MTQRIRNMDTALNSIFSGNEQRSLFQAFGINMSAFKPTANQLTTATFANDPDLWVELYGAGNHQFEILLNLTMPAAGNLKLQFVADQGLTILALDGVAEFMLDATLPGVKPIVGLGSSVSGGTTNAWSQCRVQGTVGVLNGGVLQLQVAQAAASGTTIIRGTSYFITRQLTGGFAGP